MKIISKFKDFYDFIVQDHDADLNYVRQIDICYENYDNLLKKDKNISLYHSSRNYSEGDIVFDNYIFGIYPYVYSQPIMRIFLRTLTDLNNTYDVILSKDDVDYTLENNDSFLLLKKAQKILDEHYHMPNDMEEFKLFADGKSVVNPKVNREGLVLRDPETDLSFKNVSRKYILSK